MADGLSCPVCSDAPPQAAAASVSKSESESNPTAQSTKRNRIATVAWLAAGLVAASVALILADSEYDLGIFERPASATSGTSTTTTVSPSTTTALLVTSTTGSPITTPPTTTPELVGWFEDSCVEFDGDLVDPVSCDDSYDAVIVAVAGEEASCPMATDWVVALEPKVACLDEESLGSITADFPPGVSSLEHGKPTWAVILASGSAMDETYLAEVVEVAEGAGYVTGPTDCDFGATEALGVPEGRFTVSAYLRNESDARKAKDSFASLGLVGTVAEVETYCLD